MISVSPAAHGISVDLSASLVVSRLGMFTALIVENIHLHIRNVQLDTSSISRLYKITMDVFVMAVVSQVR
jgi:hypothetical protein